MVGAATASGVASPAGMRGRARDLILCVIVVGVTALAYANSFSGPFIFDDTDSIVENPTIANLWNLPAVLSPPRDGQTVQGRPLLNLSFALNRRWAGRRYGDITRPTC